MEVVSLREELKSRSHEMELLSQQLKRKREEAQRAEDTARDRRDELAQKERVGGRLDKKSCLASLVFVFVGTACLEMPQIK